MASQRPRLRGGQNSQTLYQLGRIPDHIIESIARNLVYSSAVGRKDLSGDDWGDIFASAVGGIHRTSPLGIADVELDNTAWSAKTVSSRYPSKTIQVRLISGRNAVGYSFDNDTPLDDIQKAGRQVLDIWNARVEQATQQYASLRTVVLIRNMTEFHFTIFEVQTIQFDPADYTWKLNKAKNIEGYRNDDSDRHVFTWQPNGAQFTIITEVSGSARSFHIRKPRSVNPNRILNTVKYATDWITYIGPEIVSVAITSNPPRGDTYNTGDTIILTVTFADRISVTGSPKLALRIGLRSREANYVSGSGTSQMKFDYKVVKGDRDIRGVGIAKDSLDLRGGTITIPIMGTPCYRTKRK